MHLASLVLPTQLIQQAPVIVYQMLSTPTQITRALAQAATSSNLMVNASRVLSTPHSIPQHATVFQTPSTRTRTTHVLAATVMFLNRTPHVWLVHPTRRTLLAFVHVS